MAASCGKLKKRHSGIRPSSDNALYPYAYCYFSGDVWDKANLRDCLVDDVEIALTSHFPAVDTEIASLAPLLKFGLQNTLYPRLVDTIYRAGKISL